MTLKDWKKSKHHARADTKITWESTEGNSLAIDYVPSSNIPYKIILNDINQIDSTGSFERAKRIARQYMRTH